MSKHKKWTTEELAAFIREWNDAVDKPEAIRRTMVFNNYTASGVIGVVKRLKSEGIQMKTFDSISTSLKKAIAVIKAKPE